MRAFVRYELQIDFPEPTRGLTQLLRLTPRGFDSQHVQNWFVGVEPDARLRRTEDAFGNIAHSCSHEGPLERVTISAEGTVETTDTAGVVTGLSESSRSTSTCATPRRPMRERSCAPSSARPWPRNPIRSAGCTC